MASTKRVVIPYAPRRVFMPFHQRKERFAVGVAHRRCGKTVACINDLIRLAIMNPRRGVAPGRYGYIAPLLNQAKDAAWNYLKLFAAPLLSKVNESDTYVELINGSRIRIYGADNPDRIRGGYFDHAILDEYADMHPGVWGTIIRPMLADYQGGATFIGTPKGRNSFHAIYDRARLDPEWFTFFLPADETGIISTKELDDARRDMTAEEYNQEFLCSFDAAIMGAYFGKEIAESERQGRIRDVAYDPDLPVHTAWDLGIGDSTAIWMFQVAGSEVRVIDHYENHGHAIPHYVSELGARPYRYGVDFVPHDARVRSLETGRTRVETLIALGRKPELVPAHKIMDGINAARLLLPRCFIDRDKCATGLEALRQYRADYDDKTRAFKNAPKHDWTSHSSDAFRYLAMAYKVIVPQPEPVVLPPVKAINDYRADEMWTFNRPPKERV